MNLTISQREGTILNIAMTMLYDEIGKKGGGTEMKADLMNLSRRLTELMSTTNNNG